MANKYYKTRRHQRSRKLNTRKRPRKNCKKSRKRFITSLNRTLNRKFAHKRKGGGNEKKRKADEISNESPNDNSLSTIFNMANPAAQAALLEQAVDETYNSILPEDQPYMVKPSTYNDNTFNNTITKCKYNGELGKDSTCSICFQILKPKQYVLLHENEKLKIHGFHYNCLFNWTQQTHIKVSTDCPICRGHITTRPRPAVVNNVANLDADDAALDAELDAGINAIANAQNNNNNIPYIRPDDEDEVYQRHLIRYGNIIANKYAMVRGFIVLNNGLDELDEYMDAENRFIADDRRLYGDDIAIQNIEQRLDAYINGMPSYPPR